MHSNYLVLLSEQLVLPHADTQAQTPLPAISDDWINWDACESPVIALAQADKVTTITSASSPDPVEIVAHINPHSPSYPVEATFTLPEAAARTFVNKHDVRKEYNGVASRFLAASRAPNKAAAQADDDDEIVELSKEVFNVTTAGRTSRKHGVDPISHRPISTAFFQHIQRDDGLAPQSNAIFIDPKDCLFTHATSRVPLYAPVPLHAVREQAKVYIFQAQLDAVSPVATRPKRHRSEIDVEDREAKRLKSAAHAVKTHTQDRAKEPNWFRAIKDLPGKRQRHLMPPPPNPVAVPRSMAKQGWFGAAIAPSGVAVGRTDGNHTGITA